MQHLLVYTGAVPTGTVEGDLPALSDPAITKQNGHFILPQAMKLLMAYGIGTGISRIRLNAPYFRRTFLPYLWPFNIAVNNPNDPAFVDYRDDQLNLPALEEIECDTTTTDAGTQQHSVGLWIGNGDMSYPVGSDIYTVRCTSTITCVAYTFVSGNLTFGQTLPQGQYAIVGAHVQSATGIFFRFIIPGYQWRPGGLCVTSIGNRPPFQGDKRPLGMLGVFQSTALPQIEIFSSAADTTQVVQLDLAKVG